MRRCVTTLFLAAVLSLGGGAFAFAQGNLGAITGTVYDSSGAVVPDAAITLTETETNVTSTARSYSAGYYRVPVAPGTYRGEAQDEGFKTAVAAGGDRQPQPGSRHCDAERDGARNRAAADALDGRSRVLGHSPGIPDASH
ncbi:MAG: hypothetical protein DMG24_18300 [Acidobacteria bacterium]|nr:MAG: hypothetical protein DMG24_18300 [Acidobacteriota bacterium]